jgi:hypothetical protein
MDIVIIIIVIGFKLQQEHKQINAFILYLEVIAERVSKRNTLK